MPQPNINSVHVDAILTNISVAYLQNQDNFIADKVFPVIPVDKKSDKYFTYTKNDWFRDEAQRRAPGTESAGGGYNLSTGTYSADVWAFHKDVDDQTVANADAPLNPLREGQELSVYGNDYPTPDGTAIRDYIHVVDLAKAHVVALQRLLHKKNTQKVEVFNLGTGTGSSVLEVIAAFEKVSGQKLPYKIVGRREGDVISAYANTDKANNVLGWKAQSSLEDALASAWKWEKKIRS